MTPQARKALSKMERHRPKRYGWATALTRERYLESMSKALMQAFFVVPAAGTMSLIAYPDMPWLGWVFGIMAGQSLLVAGMAFLLVSMAFRFSVPVLSTSEFAVTMTYVAKSPEMKAIVLRWLSESQDGMLSPYQVKLIMGAARAQNILAGSTYSSYREGMVSLDEAFYQDFPRAPRFENSEGLEMEQFCQSIACLNHATDHFAWARAQRKAESLGSVWMEAVPATRRPRL